MGVFSSPRRSFSLSLSLCSRGDAKGVDDSTSMVPFQLVRGLVGLVREHPWSRACRLRCAHDVWTLSALVAIPPGRELQLANYTAIRHVWLASTGAVVAEYAERYTEAKLGVCSGATLRFST